MENGFQDFWKKNGKYLIVCTVVWLIFLIILAAPIAYTIGESTESGAFSFEVFFSNIFSNITSLNSITKIGPYMGIFGKTTLWYTIIYLLAVGVGLFKARKKGEYDKIEHGSSDWSNGEQYRILSRNSGILLAEKNYLPLDKRGNLNVLVVGRIWFW